MGLSYLVCLFIFTLSSPPFDDRNICLNLRTSKNHLDDICSSQSILAYERSPSMLYVGWAGWDGMGWLSQVIGLLRAPSMLLTDFHGMRSRARRRNCFSQQSYSWKYVALYSASKVDLRKDKKTIADLKDKGKSPISPEQGEKLAKELKYKKFCQVISVINHLSLDVLSTQSAQQKSNR